MPALLDDIYWIAQLEDKVYMEGDAIPLTKLMEWYMVNPNGFFLILENGERIGQLDILPIKNHDPIFKKFIEGSICEVDIPGASIASNEERIDIDELYVESVIIDSRSSYPSQPLGASHARWCQNKNIYQAPIRYLLSNLIPIIRNITDPTSAKYIYAIAASKAGKHLLSSLGFNIIRPARFRKDNHDMFRLSTPLITEKIGSMIKHTTVQDRRGFDLLLQKAGSRGL